MVDLRALKDRNFALGCLFSFVTGIGLFSTIYLTPLFLGRVRGLQRAADRRVGVLHRHVPDPGHPAVRHAGEPLRPALDPDGRPRAVRASSMLEYLPITHDWGAHEFLLPQALRGIGQQLAVPPTVTLTLGGLAPNRLKQASGLFNLMRNLGGAMGIAACATILTDRTNLHFLRLAEHLTPANEAMNCAAAPTSPAA